MRCCQSQSNVDSISYCIKIERSDPFSPIRGALKCIMGMGNGIPVCMETNEPHVEMDALSRRPVMI